ncbi:YjdF family protein [Paenibacillus sp. PR3]|uniref:YjdF family protein n=1 Tax=Paenibacillus terricola TaxID=2763503 RepID=A0ABR8MUG8_9BACL|nr:YjdF family protein [Paenibacillus terricola]MBD3919610.1 YjdF family protein [Paenibacillus terricola]
MKLTVMFDGQYWIGIVEEQNKGKLRAARHVFGSEPQDEEVLLFIERELLLLVSRLTQEVDVRKPTATKVNPKRLARQVASEVRSRGVSSYAQEALKLEYEKRKREKQAYSKQQREADESRKWALKKHKAKEKHRGH